jgi:hypothetical protein
MKRKQGDDGRDPAEGKTQPRDLITRLARNDVKEDPGRAPQRILDFYDLGDVEATLDLFGRLSGTDKHTFIDAVCGRGNVNMGIILALVNKHPAYCTNLLYGLEERINQEYSPYAVPKGRLQDVVALAFALAAQTRNRTVEEEVKARFELVTTTSEILRGPDLKFMLDMVPALAENKNVLKARDLYSLYVGLHLSANITGLFASDLMYVSEKTFAWRTDLKHEIGNWEEFKGSRITCKSDPEMLDEADDTKVPYAQRDVSDCGLQLPDGATTPFKHVIVNTGADLAWIPEKLTNDFSGRDGYRIYHVPDQNPVLGAGQSQQRGDAMIDVRIPKLYVATAGTRGRLVNEARVLEVDGKMIQEEKKEDVGLVPTGVFVVDTENRRCFAFVVSQRVDVSPARANVPAGRQFADCLGQVFSLDDAVLVHYFNVDRVMVHRVEEALGVQYDIWSRGGDLGAIQVAFDSVIRP